MKVGCPLSHHIIYVVTIQYTGNVNIQHMVQAVCQALLYGVSVSPLLHFSLWDETSKCSLPWAVPQTVTKELFHSCVVPLFFFDSSGNGGERGSEVQVARFIDDTSGSHPTSLPLRPLFFPAQNGTHRSPQPLSGFQFLLGKPQVFSEVIFAVSPDIKQFFFFVCFFF